MYLYKERLVTEFFYIFVYDAWFQ